jgi:hypothetical protein
MRIWLLVVAGCYPALPPPQPPRIHGAIESSGGTLGTWQISPSIGQPVDGVDALDLVDPHAPEHVLRLVRTAAEPEARPRGIQEHVASRDVELRLATKGAAEVVLARDCRSLDAIFRTAAGQAFGSARFDCTLGAAGRLRGDVEFAAGSYGGPRSVHGHVEASDGTLGGGRFEPDEGETDPRGIVVWDHRKPRVVFEIEQVAVDPSILGVGSNGTLRVTSTVAGVPSFAIARDACRVLRMDRASTGYVRVGTNQHTTWSGSVELDCATPSGGRLTGHLEFAR